MKNDRIKAAQDVLASVEQAGSIATIKNGWVVFTPPPSTELMMQTMEYSKEIVVIVGARQS